MTHETPGGTPEVTPETLRRSVIATAGQKCEAAGSKKLDGLIPTGQNFSMLAGKYTPKNGEALQVVVLHIPAQQGIPEDMTAAATMPLTGGAVRHALVQPEVAVNPVNHQPLPDEPEVLEGLRAAIDGADYSDATPMLELVRRSESGEPWLQPVVDPRPLPFS